MHFNFEGPPNLELGMPIEYYQESCETLHDSSFPGYQVFMGNYVVEGESRVISLSLREERVVILELHTFPGDTLAGMDLGLPAGKFVKDIERAGCEFSSFPESIIFYNDFVRLGCGDGLIDVIGWWDRNYWDQVSFIEYVYPK